MSDVDLTTSVAGLVLPNPVMTASGCAGIGKELDQFFDVTELGAVVTRSVTLDPRAGWSGPRMVETPSGMLSGTGLQNPGLQGFLATELPWLAQRQARAIVSVAGNTLGEYAELARRVGDSPGVSAVEVNLSCPNADFGDREVACDPYLTGKVLSVVRRDVPRGIPVLAKLSADAPSIVDVAAAAVKAGADGLVMLNTLAATVLDPETLRPALGCGTGGLSGPAVHPVAVRCVWEVHQAMPDVPIVGVGGVRTGFDALQLLAAGASAVQVGSAIFSDPSAPLRVVGELRAELARRDLPTIADVIGRAHHPEGDLS
ncbi:MAG TPA: dihydroorotate dehydrogenase [Nocardioidaceae bacterium]|nr:dihydroorotate dehydrogenase [Nocardioidaceae bacterium]